MSNINKKIIVKCLNCGETFHPKYAAKRSIFCSHKCQQEHQHKEYIRRWKNGEESGVTANCDISDHIRKYLIQKYNGGCQVCGWNKINPFTGKVPLQIHHIDGDCTNNKEDNLQLLCPNCHSLTETFGARNRVNGSKRTHRLGN